MYKVLLDSFMQMIDQMWLIEVHKASQSSTGQSLLHLQCTMLILTWGRLGSTRWQSHTLRIPTTSGEASTVILGLAD